MPKPIEEMTPEEIAAERAAIAIERAELAQATSNGSASAVPDPRDMAELARHQAVNAETDIARELYEAIAEDYETAAVRNGHDARITAIEQDARARRKAAEPSTGEDEKPKPWPHQHLTYEGLELEVRIPNQGALMAISMLPQLDEAPELQMDIFNTFIRNHLSVQSFATVIRDMTRPDSEMSFQGLVQALVNMRVNAD